MFCSCSNTGILVEGVRDRGHFDRLKPCVALPEATPLEENTVQRDEDRETTPLLVTQEEATITDPLEGIY